MLNSLNVILSASERNREPAYIYSCGRGKSFKNHLSLRQLNINHSFRFAGIFLLWSHRQSHSIFHIVRGRRVSTPVTGYYRVCKHAGCAWEQDNGLAEPVVERVKEQHVHEGWRISRIWGYIEMMYFKGYCHLWAVIEIQINWRTLTLYTTRKTCSNNISGTLCNNETNK